MQLGRSCPLYYRYAPQDLAREPDFEAETLYIIGGLYGNVPAVEAVIELAARERMPTTLAFNGDFNWFNIDDTGFRTINHVVLNHHALRGNVETEIASDNNYAGCGCGYPDYVSDAEVARSNDIIVRLRNTARRHADLRERLAALPMHLVARVGGERIAIVHGDLESLAGWSLSQEMLARRDATNNIQKHIVESNCTIITSSHTCLPVALTLNTPDGRRAIFNNGSAGMPNFRDTSFGVITRISTVPTLADVARPLFGTRIGAVYIDALPLPYDHADWQRTFLSNWPAGSAGHTSYYQRMTGGPAYAIADADRLNVSHSRSVRPTAAA